MLKEFLTTELEKIQSRRDEYLKECGNLEAILGEVDTIPMDPGRKGELVRLLNGRIMGKQGAARLADDRIVQLTGFLKAIGEQKGEENHVEQEEPSSGVCHSTPKEARELAPIKG